MRPDDEAGPDAEFGWGHRVLPHTADIRIEAWGPNREVCLAEAVAALVGSFADTSAAPATRVVETELTAATDEDALLEVLDEVIYRLDTEDAVPLEVEIQAGQASLRTRMTLADLHEVDVTGAVPKAVSLNDLYFSLGEHGWSCTATIDI